MATDIDNDPRIPTLTDVVKQGNPSLMFNLRPPPSSVAEDEPDAGDTDTTAGDPEDVMELEVFEREVQAEMFQVTGHPDDSDLVITEKSDGDSTAVAEGSAVIVEPQAPVGEDAGQEPEPPKSSFSLEALGLPFDFFNKATQEDKAEETASDTDTEAPLISQEHEETQPVSGPPEIADIEGNELPDLDVESVLMALEAPISEILQRHMDSARDEIHGLIREQLERHHQN
ncbi:MAG: hypothetical protein R3312_08940 [Gammaproteobacteria bacterium]|nr:hypothetical protein [Gammaproteobacteria bacterium]